MPGRTTMRHSEDWWEMLSSPSAVRCEGHVQNGSQCRREAVLGATVCRQHGGAAPQVRAKAAARIGNAADEMVKRLFALLDDPETPHAVKAKVAQDMLDRADLGAVQKHIVGVGPTDPVEQLFRSLLAQPDALASPAPRVQAMDPVYEAYNRHVMEADDVVDAEVVEEEPPSPSPASEPPKGTKPPKHIREGLERAEEMRRLGLA